MLPYGRHFCQAKWQLQPESKKWRARNADIAMALAGAARGHLAGELLKIDGKLIIQHVLFLGAAPAVSDLLGGQVK